MENLLRIDFTAFNALPASTITNIRSNTLLTYFEVEDVNRVIQIQGTTGFGTGKYRNPQAKDVTIIDYDGFLTSLPAAFQHGKKRCDIIVYTSDDSHFILNELKNRNPHPSLLTKATAQLLSTLTEIGRVPTIATFINNFIVKKCCYSNKQSIPPSPIVNATTAFNRINTLVTNGLKLSYPPIEAFGFELYEYSGNQVIDL